MKIACDEFSVPTSTVVVVELTLKAIKVGLEGLYHLVNTGFASRYEYAREILRILEIKMFIKPVYREIFPLPAKRPMFSAMSNSKLSADLGITISDWREELENFLLKGGLHAV